MEEMMKQSKAASSPLAMHRDSHVVSKLKPKIRIVHIFAPQIIKTDVANFRELVQRLTGKPREKKSGNKKGRNKRSPESRTPTTILSGHMYQNSGCCFDKIKEEEEEEEAICGDVNCSSGFFNGLGDLDGFIQGLGELPLNAASRHMHMDLFGQTQLY